VCPNILLHLRQPITLLRFCSVSKTITNQWKITGCCRTLDFRAIEAGGLSQISSSWIIAHQNRFRMGNHPNPLLVTLPTSYFSKCKTGAVDPLRRRSFYCNLQGFLLFIFHWTWSMMGGIQTHVYRKITLTPSTNFGGLAQRSLSHCAGAYLEGFAQVKFFEVTS